MLQTSLLFFALAIASLECAVISDLPSSGNIGFHVDLDRRNAQLGDGVRDWFRNMRDKVLARESMNQINLPNPLNFNPGTALKLYTGDAPDRVIIQPGNFFLDLTNFKFNPNTDIGFHIGNWYIIRRSEPVEEMYAAKSMDDWGNWKDFIDSKEENERESDSNEDKSNDESETSSPTGHTIRTEKSAKILGEEKESNENGAMNNLSIEVVKPLAETRERMI